MWPQAKEVTRRAYHLGVPLVGATDINYQRVFDSGRWTIADNAAGLVQARVLKMKAIKAITSEAAKLLEINKRTGAIWKGLEAASDPHAAFAKAIGKTPVWIFHGAQDDTIDVNKSRKMAAALKAAGGTVKYTEYPEEKHFIADRVFY